jgi:hypothetical protein
MRTLRKIEVELEMLAEGEYVPDRMEFGKLYYSPDLMGSSHLCLCGCGHPCYLPIKEGEWNITINDNKMSVTPSILQLFECGSHYIITNNVANFV